MDYLSVDEARRRPGLKLVLTAHVPGPWGQAAKAVLNYRQVPFVAVEQRAGEDNAELLAWTGRRNAPIAILDDEPPYDDWLQILFLAERLGTGTALLPDDPRDRVACLGYCLEICGYWGLGWCRRISMWTLSGPPQTERSAFMRRNYGYSADTADRAPARLREIISGLDRQLESQQARNSQYLIGDRPSAADLYWAAFSIMFDVPDHLVDRIPAFQRAMYETIEPAIVDVLTPRLIAHRDFIFQTVIGLPIEF